MQELVNRSVACVKSLLLRQKKRRRSMCDVKESCKFLRATVLKHVNKTAVEGRESCRLDGFLQASSRVERTVASCLFIDDQDEETKPKRLVGVSIKNRRQQHW
jgi:hypothetical protein